MRKSQEIARFTLYLNNRKSVWVDIRYIDTMWPREEAYCFVR